LSLQSLTGSTGATVMPNFGTTGGVVRTKFEYPASLPPLSPGVKAAYGAQRRAATGAVEDAGAYRGASLAQAQAARMSATNELTRQGGRDTNDLLNRFAAQGRGRSPLGRSEGVRRIGSGMERQQIVLEEELLKLTTELDRMVADTTRQAERTYADIDLSMAQQKSQAALEDMRARQRVDELNRQYGLA
jgi:hypothetical protein